jgi:hypothetical protein
MLINPMDEGDRSHGDKKAIRRRFRAVNVANCMVVPCDIFRRPETAPSGIWHVACWCRWLRPIDIDKQKESRT